MSCTTSCIRNRRHSLFLLERVDLHAWHRIVTHTKIVYSTGVPWYYQRIRVLKILLRPLAGTQYKGPITVILRILQCKSCLELRQLKCWLHGCIRKRPATIEEVSYTVHFVYILALFREKISS